MIFDDKEYNIADFNIAFLRQNLDLVAYHDWGQSPAVHRSVWAATARQTVRWFCSACGWPVCGEECATLEPHKGSECAVFAAAGVRYQQEAEEEDTNGSPQYECITPLRMLLNKEKAPDRWQAEIDEMEAHTEERKAQSEWKTEQINVVEFLRKKCRLAERFSEDIIHFVIGVLEVNAFEVRTENGFFVRGLYPQTAIMSHNCVANTTHTIYPADNFR
ncbi:SET domain-containing protein SmydA-8-like [Homalodisca vitripennis]|uniref:SET domain-containing protein SmydA-8-like n=1 Tax=Homalodisca vitripennis TaxID=197043 RepID=UPI001EEA9A37|nr:SET domain-containing protein SmydA-8-like [Homalodisca vitripennis]